MDKERQLILTQKGLEKIKKELDLLVTKKRPKTILMVQSSKEQGDLSENAGYQSAIEDLTMIDRRIEELTEIVKNAKVMETNSNKKTIVEVGCKVTVKDSNGQKYVYEIVGVSEADPLKGKISYESPIGKALYKKKVGEKATVVTPVGESFLQITNLE